MTGAPTITPDQARARQVETILERVQSLPTLSPVAARLLSIGTIDQVLIGDVVKIIETDPALSARILGLCRKADRGLGDRITTVKRAVLMLGIEAVRSAALSVSVYDLMTREDDAARTELDAAVSSDDSAPASGWGPGQASFDRKGFWKHSIAVACAAELIAATNPKLRVLPEEAFLAGLLHDVGKLVLELVLPLSYQRVVQLAHRRASDSAGIERIILGLDHHTAGRRVAAHWGLPEPLQNVIWLHAQPFAALPLGPDRALIGIITVAKAVCRRLHLGWSGDFAPPPDADRLWAEMSLKATGPASIAGPLHAAIADRLKVLGLDDVTPPGLLLESLANANRQLSDLNTALQERAQQSQAQSRVLDAIDQFYSLFPVRRPLAETMSLVATSAHRAFGPGFYALLVQDGPEQPWRMVQLSPSGTPLGAQVLDTPPARLGTLSSLTNATQLNVAMLGLLPWISDHLISAPDLRKLRLLPLSASIHPNSREPAPGAILITDQEMSEGIHHTTLRSLTATWAASIAAAADREAGRRLHDQLVESSRAVSDLQTKLAEQESMARLGQTTAGAAHEMNNPLTIVAGHAQLLLSRLDNDRDLAAAQAISNAAADLTSLISSLHILSTKLPNNPKPHTLDPLINRVVQNAHQRCNRQTPAVIRIDPIISSVSLDADLLVGCLTELVANAIDACPDGPIAIIAAPTRSGALLITIQDQGTGLSDNARQHAFDPFFSEHAAGRGKGLGLPRARNMAHAMGGELVLENSPPQGVSATLALPAGTTNPAAPVYSDHSSHTA